MASLITLSCDSGSGARSTDYCTAAVTSEHAIGLLKAAAVNSDLVVTLRGRVSRIGSCEGSLANVERVDSDLFLVYLELTPVIGANGAAVLLEQVRSWEAITDATEHDRRAAETESTLTAMPGLEGAAVAGRCSVPEVTCRYWILVDDWLVDAQILYFGRVDQYGTVVEMGDELLIDVAALLGNVVMGIKNQPKI